MRVNLAVPQLRRCPLHRSVLCLQRKNLLRAPRPFSNARQLKGLRNIRQIRLSIPRVWPILLLVEIGPGQAQSTLAQ